MDYSYYNQAFVDGLKAFLDYTAPDSLRNNVKEGLVVRRRLQKQDFEKRCIQRWAISQLTESIINNPSEPIEDTTYKLALKLLSFAVNSTNPNVRNVFSIAAAFIEDEVINLFREKAGIYP